MSKTINTLIENPEDLDIVLPMYNLLEYSHNYSMISGSLWNYYREKIDDIDDNSSDGELFNYKGKIVEEIPERPPKTGNPKNENQPLQPPVPSLIAEVTVPLKYLNNFWRFLGLALIKYEVKLDYL